jgi:hypothetical protein
MRSTTSDKSKPVERRGRKAMDLQSQLRDHDSQVAEDTFFDFFWRAWFNARLFLLEPYHCMFDKGKPVERRGRKAMDLQSQLRDHDSQVADVRKTKI